MLRKSAWSLHEIGDKAPVVVVRLYVHKADAVNLTPEIAGKFDV